MNIMLLRLRPIISLVAIFSLTFCLAEVHALMKKLTIEQLTASAESVVVGYIESMTSKWKGDIIVTEVSVQVADTVAGEFAGQRIIVEYPGGEVGDVGLLVSDVKMPAPGDNVLLFLKLTDGNYTTVGMAQGQYFVDSDKDVAYREGFKVGGDRMLAADEDSISFQELLRRIKEARIEK